MFFQFVILLVLLISISGIVIWFLKRNREMNLHHNENVSVLRRGISQNRNQIDFRKYHLSNYDFLKYNLQDALIIQPKIIL